MASMSLAFQPAWSSACLVAASARSELPVSSPDPAPLLDAGALADPLVGGVHAPGQLLVGDDAVRDAGAEGGDGGAGHGGSSLVARGG